jgi:hypothetical protein
MSLASRRWGRASQRGEFIAFEVFAAGLPGLREWALTPTPDPHAGP